MTNYWVSMKFKLDHNYLPDKLSRINRYTSKDEKDALLLEDSASFTEIAEVLLRNSDVSILNEPEAVALIFKAREISVSDVIDTTITCGSCGYQNVVQLEIGPMFHDTGSTIPQGVFTDINEILSEEAQDDLVLRDLDQVEEELKTPMFSPIQHKNCKKCNSVMNVTINPRSIISISNISSIYREYFDLTMYTNNTTDSIDNTYPFEREFYLSLLKDKLKDKG